MKPHDLVTDPKEFVERFVEAFNNGELDHVVEFYSTQAVLNLGGGQVFRGRAAIRPVLANFLAPKLPMRVTPRSLVTSGDTGLAIFDWTIEGIGPDGTPVNLSGTTSDVIHREPDGFWRHLLDHPFGSGTKPSPADTEEQP